MEPSKRRQRIRELKEELSYKESQFWEDSPYHDMKISVLREELADLQKEESEDSIFSFKKLKDFLDAIIKLK